MSDPIKGKPLSFVDKGTLQEGDWQNLQTLTKRRKGKCTPFIGAGGNKGILPTGKQIASNWSGRHSYPLSDSAELARVARRIVGSIAFLNLASEDDHNIFSLIIV